MASLKGQIAIVTGSSRGIGRAIARRLAAAECDLALLARSQEELQALAWEIKTAGREALAIPTDLRDAGQIEAGVGKALQYFGRVDILVNNAGLWHYAPIENLSVADWDEMFDVNLRAMFLCTKAVLPSMFERGRGHIVNVGSTSGIIAEDEGTGYCATKWGARGFSQTLYKEVRPRGIRVTLVEPGVVNNGEGTSDEDRAWLQNEDIAEVVYTAAALPPRATLFEAVLWPLAEQVP